ncbi:(2Fe-2S)-binding protein [Mycolicibacterium hippocampi]|uniref:Ferric siderophore reductase C-terminal domain-containing protein n=1 Tax=Mycolicibacterium hippocampi TaxID=659824 RepID=A0A7I9ZM51_9MYCO|nr:(2Fe-2S)-binding protein [Mycolicibacterium hippocampi]GFH01698.1 hypothetical protein MHIP_21810 [Mycolicibacterium hippocampi]
MNSPARDSAGHAARPGLVAQLATLGEYFAIPPQDDGEWRTLPGLLNEVTLRGFVDRTRTAIAAASRCQPGEIPLRLAASSFQLGITARLLSPAVGAASCFDAVPLLGPDSLTWRPTPKPFPQFAAPHIDWADGPTPARAAELIKDSLLRGVLGPLNDTLDRLLSLPPQVSWGNVISAANGAVTVLSMSQPHRESAGRELVRALLDIEPLAGTATYTQGRFVRRSCCLFYQAPRAGLCGDCVLGSAPDA